MRRDAGISLIELLVVVALLALVATVGLLYSMRWMAGETLRTAAHEMRAQLRLTQIESVSRNRPCRFELDAAHGSMIVWDTVGTANPSDDVPLHDARLPTAIGFARPDAGSTIGLASLGNDRYQVIFDSEGIVAVGDGEVHLQGSDQFGKVSIFVAGGIEIAYWTGSRWKTGA
jgi:prepilin-type N-terminal cleavage/methylation domain-containing protein